MPRGVKNIECVMEEELNGNRSSRMQESVLCVINSRRTTAPRVIVVGQSVCPYVCIIMYSESAHLDGIALCLYYG